LTFLKRLEKEEKANSLPSYLAAILKTFYESYRKALGDRLVDEAHLQSIFDFFLNDVLIEVRTPYHFEPYHRALRAPLDFYQFGLDLMRPLVILEQSKILGRENLDQIQRLIDRKENVILLANHQTEPDPQLISLILEKTHAKLAEEMIFVAGHRVVTDPLAIPFSKGRHLLCIYSKRHIENPPEKKAEKIQHNQKTMKMMANLLEEGGHCIYVAPSGGRDRPNAQGLIEVAPFDPGSVEMFGLMAKQSHTPTHFFPLALSTYALLPPPNSIQAQIGEQRSTQQAPIHLAFCQEVHLEQLVDATLTDKKARRQMRADKLTSLVKQAYSELA